MTTYRRSKAYDDEDDESIWDPIWEYVLGEDDSNYDNRESSFRSRIGWNRNRGGSDANGIESQPSFLGSLFPSDDEANEGKRSSQKGRSSLRMTPSHTSNSLKRRQFFLQRSEQQGATTKTEAESQTRPDHKPWTNTSEKRSSKSSRAKSKPAHGHNGGRFGVDSASGQGSSYDSRKRCGHERSNSAEIKQQYPSTKKGVKDARDDDYDPSSPVNPADETPSNRRWHNNKKVSVEEERGPSESLFSLNDIADTLNRWDEASTSNDSYSNGTSYTSSTSNEDNCSSTSEDDATSLSSGGTSITTTPEEMTEGQNEMTGVKLQWKPFEDEQNLLQSMNENTDEQSADSDRNSDFIDQKSNGFQDKGNQEGILYSGQQSLKVKENRSKETMDLGQESKNLCSKDSCPNVKKLSIMRSNNDVITSKGRKGIGKIACWNANSQLREELEAMEIIAHIHELSSEELATIFPKLRVVSDEKLSRASKVIGNSNTFENNLPASLQLPSKALVLGSGPRSLLEYEYECGSHMSIIYGMFGNNPRSQMKVLTHPDPPPCEQIKAKDTTVVVQIEASTISLTDCLIRRGEWWGKGPVPLPVTPGVDFVGRLYRISTEASRKFGLSMGDRVISLVKWGGNSRYISINPAQLVKIPESVDPAEAACLAEAYLTAFRVLHMGQGSSTRYQKDSLKGKSVLVVGSMSSNLGQAFSQLAALGGIVNFYATAELRHFASLATLGVLPVSKDPLDWWERLEGKIDCIVALENEVTPLHHKVLKDSGDVIVLSHYDVGKNANVEDRPKVGVQLMCSRGRSHWRSRTNPYDVYKEWTNKLNSCKDDLEHLVELLEQGALTPYVLDRVPLGKVARAQELVQTKRHSGFVICEPWLLSKSRAVRL